ncbi:MAG TPA: adenosylcobinamide-GDP ribazoletransferase, partial [Clostridiaceae bacterium]|nr:adenosylcobinamide-GDP ribazoletransferase [Clostridiaceae bacterium]
MKKQRQSKRNGWIGFWSAFPVALSMYSTLPVPMIDFTPVNMRWAMIWFPFIGAFSGAILWGLLHLSLFLGINHLVFAALALCLSFFISGGIHLDGFCDAADAIGSRRDAQEQLRIMRDPHVGPFAAIMLVFLLISQFAFYTQLYDQTDWHLWI